MSWGQGPLTKLKQTLCYIIKHQKYQHLTSVAITPINGHLTKYKYIFLSKHVYIAKISLVLPYEKFQICGKQEVAARQI